VEGLKDGTASAPSPRTLVRLRAAVRTYDPDGVMVIGRVLDA
jgi:hypothetical protein